MALESLKEKNFSQRLDLEFTQEVAKQRNKISLPPISDKLSISLKLLFPYKFQVKEWNYPLMNTA
jgi:hypothetical protein